MREAVLVRHGEVFLKGKNRAFFERRLVENLKHSLAGEGHVQRIHGRELILPGSAGIARVMERAQRVFGISSLSPVEIVERDVAQIYPAAVRAAAREVERLGGGRPTFKVESRRSDKRFRPTSPEMSRHAGAAIIAALGLPVDVHKPIFEVGIEVGFEHAYIYASTIPGPGGLPTGVTGKTMLLLSGGIDSPVAGWLTQKRGCELEAVYFHSPPYTGEHTKEKVTTLARSLARWQTKPIRLHVVPFADAQKQLRAASGDGRLAVVLYRRAMMRIATALAEQNKCPALVTGEALAQVASQTLDNLTVISQSTTMPILRPCIGHDKLETIAIAKRIGTFETSILPYDDCCSLFVPEHPETRAKMEQVQGCEANVDMPALVAASLAGVELITCSAG